MDNCVRARENMTFDAFQCSEKNEFLVPINHNLVLVCNIEMPHGSLERALFREQFDAKFV